MHATKNATLRFFAHGFAMLAGLTLLGWAVLGCGGLEGQGTEEPAPAPSGKAEASAQAVFYDFTFAGALVTDYAWSAEQQIESQLLYTVGHLNGERSLGRLDRVALSDVRSEQLDDGRTRISYRATMPVAWNKRNEVPERYTLRLPYDVSYRGLEDFTGKYSHDCVDYGAHDVTSGSMWYYFRPRAYGCTLDEQDIFVTEATLAPSTLQSHGKYPEYHKVWEDSVLKVVAVFGKNEDGATSSSDAGISAYNRFVRQIKDALAPYGLQTVPESVPYSPGVELPDITFTAQLGDGKSVEVVTLLVDNVRTADQQFRSRYEQLSTRADLIAYNGHAGLGANIRALADRGHWVADQYVMVFMDGCDSYAYVDSALFDAHAAVNPDDPTGTRHIDIVMNAMPAFFTEIANSTMALVRGLMAYDAPKTFEQILGGIDSSQVALVSGEQDNVFTPDAFPL